MKILGPTRFPRVNEAGAFVFLFAGLFLILCLASYHSQDPSWNSITGAAHAQNLIGLAGAYTADLCFQLLGFSAFSLPVLLWLLAWKWIRSAPIQAAGVKVFGAFMLFLSISTALSIHPFWRPWSGAFSAGGVVGILLADSLITRLNATGTVLLTGICLLLSLYLISKFSVSIVARWFAGPLAFLGRIFARFGAWRERRLAAAEERAEQRAAVRVEKRAAKAASAAASASSAPVMTTVIQPEPVYTAPPIIEPPVMEPPVEQEIPIHELEYQTPPPSSAPPWDTPEPERAPDPPPARKTKRVIPEAVEHPAYHLPSTELLNEVPARNPFDSIELKDIAGRIKSKFEEFNVHGGVVQINPGPVVTTFEFKPEAGVKYSRITTLTEDLCLGLQAESILIERIPGKPTVGIEVPNTRREVISLRQILESEEFLDSGSRLTICLGKDISGRIKVAALESMPHLLIAGSTGAGKSVMLNSMIMSILYKSTPDEVRMILVDPKRLEMGLYEGIPHLLTPVITDAKKATYALRNAVLEMERRLKLLAAQGVRNIDQYNKKVRALANEPRSLFEEDDEMAGEELKPLPFILIVIDELADLMMLERANVEEAVARLAQMARAVGMHLVLATQRPSVDVITGLIKANFPSRISFRVATRVDSRTVLDVMGAEHLLGKGDMLFLPPGSSRLTRVHGAFVTEAEINRVVESWKAQARPDYDQTFLQAPPSDDADPEGGEFEGGEDPAYQDAVRVVLEMGKASTSTLQRRLRLGYGRAARILDMMQHEGIIGPPDGSKPREVLKRPDWLEEVEKQFR
ncbi:MAG TPA: DNA translocase FtsK 4TM domain-containing protein [Bryobacteraceae bacterium]|nr:DNA translocase FtsK 4TM domain-containing protein [Bryobacteraceae bacterium]